MFICAGPIAECSFDKYGPSSSCVGGLGSADSFTVYSLNVNVPDNTIRLSYEGMMWAYQRY